MKKYIKDNTIIVEGTAIEYNGVTYFNPSASRYEACGWTEYNEPVHVVTQEELDEQAKYGYEEKMTELKEKYLSELIENGTSATATEYKEVKALYDAIGKVVQTAEGDGTMENPYKTWKSGMSVKANDWWMTEDGYLWMAKMSGVPSSSMDSEYWDVIE